jgi:uncharacterized protein (DUF2062 family)
MPVIYLTAYLLGSALLNAPVIDASAVDWLDPFSPELLSIWPSFLVGCFVMGVLVAFVGYFVADGLWRLRIAQRISERASRHRERRAQEKRKRDGNSR